MTNTKIVEQVDIYKLPTARESDPQITEVTIGDLHGNSMKLMYMLIREGIASGVKPVQYSKLVTIYKKDVKKLTANDIKEFNAILDDITFDKSKLVRLIGDELADRGSNDYFTLKILEKLDEQDVPVEILISNHSVEFLQACEKYQKKLNFHAPMLRNGHADSLVNLDVLVSNGLVESTEVLDIAKKAYQPKLKVVSYSLNPESTEITLYSHAGIGLDTIKQLAKKDFICTYNDSNAPELAKTIDDINSGFQQKFVKQSIDNESCKSEIMYRAYDGACDLSQYPFVCAMWNRFYNNLRRPPELNNYKIVYVHGHDSNDPMNHEDHVCNLDFDNFLGKSLSGNIGIYKVLRSSTTFQKQEIIDNAQNEEVTDSETRKNSMMPGNDHKSLSNLLTSLNSQLIGLDEKAEILRKKNKMKAADAVSLLTNTIRGFTQQLNKDEVLAPQYSNDCQAAITTARKVLENHRSYKLALSYLALTITGIGLAVVIGDIGYKAHTGKHLTFFQTDTAQKVSKLEEIVSRINPKS